MSKAVARLQVEMFGSGSTTVIDADGRAHAASVAVRELKNDANVRADAAPASAAEVLASLGADARRWLNVPEYPGIPTEIYERFVNLGIVLPSVLGDEQGFYMTPLGCEVRTLARRESGANDGC